MNSTVSRSIRGVASLATVAVLASSCSSIESTAVDAGAGGVTTSSNAEPEAPARPTVTEATFTDDWPCGYGFWASDSAQTVSLRIEFTDYEAARAGDLPSPAPIDGDGWTASVLVGADLMANWCDDVMEEGEPEPRVDETWDVVGGSIEVEGPPTDGGCGQPIRAVVSDLVIQPPSGDELRFTAPLELENEAWGCFAG